MCSKWWPSGISCDWWQSQSTFTQKPVCYPLVTLLRTDLLTFNFRAQFTQASKVLGNSVSTINAQVWIYTCEYLFLIVIFSSCVSVCSSIAKGWRFFWLQNMRNCLRQVKTTNTPKELCIPRSWKSFSRCTPLGCS